jgi:hypothetical protein
MDILELIDRGTANVALHDQSRRLRASAEAFLTVYDSYPGYSVVAASPQAERVLGAVMMLRPEVNATGHGRALIFDVNVASGTLIARLARRLRDTGNTNSLVGVALHSLVGARLDLKIEGLTDLVIVDRLDLASRARQSPKCRNRRVQLAG